MLEHHHGHSLLCRWAMPLTTTKKGHDVSDAL